MIMFTSVDIIDISSWKPFRYDNIFIVKKGKRLTKADMDDGETPFISATASNNGITNYIDAEPQHEGNTITVNYDGSVGEAFYQPDPFWALDDVNVLYPNNDNYPDFHINKYNAMFLISIIMKEKFRYNYGRKWKLDRMNEAIMYLPVDKKEDPDFAYMEEYIKILFEKISFEKIVSDSLSKKDVKISIEKWKPFRYDNIFIVKKGKRLTKADMDDGETPFISATASNNGITNYIDAEPQHEGNTITVNYDGSVGEAFYQPDPFWALDDVNVLYPNNDNYPDFHINKYNAMFLISIIMKEKFRYNYGRKWKLDRMNEAIMYLPVDKKEDPDFAYMEEYIKSLKYSSNLKGNY